MYVQILKWAGRILRTFSNRIQKQIVEGSFGGRKPAGRSINGWEEVLEDLVILINTEKNGSQRKDKGVTGGKNTRRPWPGNGRKCYTSRWKFEIT
jgi:hypothetical protein